MLSGDSVEKVDLLVLVKAAVLENSVEIPPTSLGDSSVVI